MYINVWNFYLDVEIDLRTTTNFTLSYREESLKYPYIATCFSGKLLLETDPSGWTNSVVFQLLLPPINKTP